MGLQLKIQKILALGLFILGFAFQSPGQETFKNPILAGWYPDPAITDDGMGNFYMVHSTFAFYPGISVFHSTDLVNWKQIGNVIDRPDQIDLEGFGVSRAIFAPDISFDEGTFYVTCTVVDGKGNFVVTAKDPAGPWSDPVWLPEVQGIDPGLFFDVEKSYIVYNGDAPDNKPLYDGHRTIRMFEFDKQNLETVGENRILVNGGVDISTKPVWAEGPRIYKLNGYYYLMTAEGGTAINHSEMIYRNRDIDDEFIPFKENPILTQRHLDPDREDPVTSAGHADIIQHPNGDWYGVFLAVRPYEGDFYNTCRETFLTPVKWENDWPIFDLGGEEIQYEYPLPEGTKINKDLFPLNGNFQFKKDFENKKLDLHWLFLRNPKEDWYSLKDREGYLVMKTRAETVSGTANPSFLSHRQQHLKGEAAVSLNFDTKKENEKAGLIAFQNEAHFYFIAKSYEGNSPVVQLFKGAENGEELLASQKLPASGEAIEFKVEFDEDVYRFFYKTGSEWKNLGGELDGKYLSTKVAGGFVGNNLGMYTTSNEEESKNKAAFDWFSYLGDDEVYQKEQGN
ncbi:glycoside hydrolase family 43 protein [Antarcticibacterium sp. 1MA-6-2]|uniref:glycoside hydrolase family 43 protein n=1 Tax=Antarcticibacterium sp. 1MA-6-2 TaxID=2908210 RepID=UPI001F2385AA|nr:glycoside hydrolase family 43 protein [Antarcticibacterium sp. 1MA-6-2]UJH90636.1 glycoside hydrolase family 43 protein [Antarcticibacterium sp. 1MA-6-2]